MRRLLLTTLSALVLAAGCGTGTGSSSSSGTGGGATTGSGSKGNVTVAAFNFAESQILANMYADLAGKAGYQATVKNLTNREVIEPALERGELGVVPEYLATFTEFLNNKANGANAAPKASGNVQKTLTAARALAQPRGLVVLQPSQAADQNAFAVKKSFATANHLTTLSDLGNYSGKLVLGGPPECPKRTYCQPGLEKTYGIHFTGFKALDAGGPLTKTALQKGQVQIGLVFSSDPSVDAAGLVILDDDKHLQNADVVVPVVSKKADQPALEQALNKLAPVLTTADLKALNAKSGDPAQIAKDYLTSKGLL